MPITAVNFGVKEASLSSDIFQSQKVGSLFVGYILAALTGLFSWLLFSCNFETQVANVTLILQIGICFSALLTVVSFVAFFRFSNLTKQKHA